MENQFKKIYDSLNPEQKLAVNTIEGSVMVIAGPGTGKTQILTLRIANILLKTQINPENILALTFSDSASLQMRQRLSEIIGTPAFRVDISTFHSFANEIIKNYPDEFPKLLSSENMTEIEQIELIVKLIDLLDLKLLRPYGEPLYYLKDILALINDLKKEGVLPDDLKKAIENQKKDFKSVDDLYHEKGIYKGQMKGKYQDLEKAILKQGEFLQVFAAYSNALDAQKKYDYNDMLLEVIKALENNNSLLLRIQEKYQYILIDEHQDTNAAQNKLIEQVASFFEVPNLFVVGDVSQAIYRFQGASLENFLYFKKLYPGAKLINLEMNYRSHQLILDAAGSLIEKNISANILPQPKLLADKKKLAEKIKVIALSDYHFENEFIADNIEKKISEGVEPDQIAVLARRNIDLEEIAQSLKRRGIQFNIQSDQDIFSDLTIQKLILILQAVENFGDEESFIKASHVDFLNIEPIDIYKILNYSRREASDIFSIISKVKKLSKQLSLEKVQALVDFNLKFNGWVKLNHNIPLDDLFVKIINESGMREYVLKSTDNYQTLNKLISLFDEIKIRLYKNPEFDLTNFIQLLETVKKHKVVLNSKSKNSFVQGVALLTVHKSKGQEFDYVYILNCFDGRWGNSRRRSAKIKLPWAYLGGDKKTNAEFDEIEDERRLFYVGLTRARVGVTLTYSNSDISGKVQLPSQFIQEINPDLVEEIDTQNFEKNFDKQFLFDEAKTNSIDLKNQEYFSKQFLEKGLSVTGFENFLDCPWKYFFRNLVMLPDVKNKYLIFGTLIHNVLDLFIRQRKNKKLTANFLISNFKDRLNEQALSENDRQELLEKGENVLKAFYYQVIPNWPMDIQSEMVIRGVKISEQITLNGRLDMIEPLLNSNMVRVHDFKTGKPKSRSQIDGSKIDSNYNYLRQLTFYKILLDRYKEGLFKMSEGVIDFVEPDERGIFHSEVFAITEGNIKELEDQIKFVADQIINLKFWDQYCDKKDCEYCNLAKMVFNN